MLFYTFSCIFCQQLSIILRNTVPRIITELYSISLINSK